jgi:hypothetical protein
VTYFDAKVEPTDHSKIGGHTLIIHHYNPQQGQAWVDLTDHQLTMIALAILGHLASVKELR